MNILHLISKASSNKSPLDWANRRSMSMRHGAALAAFSMPPILQTEQQPEEPHCPSLLPLIISVWWWLWDLGERGCLVQRETRVSDRKQRGEKRTTKVMGKISLRESAMLIFIGAIILDVSWNICQLLDADQWVRGNLGYLCCWAP